MDKKILHDIVAKAIRGDTGAFESLYTLYAKSILFHTRNLISVEADVEDVAQEVVIQMYRSIGTLKSPYAFSSWLNRVVVNVCNNYNRKHMSTRSRDYALETADELYEEDECSLPEASAENEDVRARFLRSIEALPQMQRTALIMYYYDEMSYKEIAKALDVTVSTISTNIRKAKLKLETMLENDRNNGKDGNKPGSDAGVYSGIAIGPFIAESLRFGADSGVPAAEIDRFCKSCKTGIESYTGPRSAPRSRLTARTVKYLSASAAAIAVMVVAFVLFQPAPADEPLADPPGQSLVATSSNATAPGQYTPDAQIDFTTSGESSGSVNPAGAEVIIKDGIGKAISWSVTDVSGTEIASGEGAKVAEPLKTLSPGEYRIQWQLQNEAGAGAGVRRSFFVE
ncbi:MAG: sigma-70 family RNA polymerase sigma factor [Clostridiales Family XIII bacterium]|jgi:RNA polymerase sigma factor (sigma-70 family)|nr:sigma-70 family RNA polymerase sigma factor [Clostridiales Family XIII bacterium]